MVSRLSVSWDCLTCGRPVEAVAPDEKQPTFSCPHGCRPIYSFPSDWSACPVCGCRQFYRQKDFPRGWGCLLVLIGILLSPATYGLSLIVLVVLDAVLYRRCPEMANCYCCGAEFRGAKLPERLKPYRHAIALRYDDKRKNLRSSS